MVPPPAAPNGEPTAPVRPPGAAGTVTGVFDADQSTSVLDPPRTNATPFSLPATEAGNGVTVAPRAASARAASIRPDSRSVPSGSSRP
ncbi:hypothetical protein DDE19_16360 [Micromonospora ureilytica]|uniref:Uncharacterized protein n=1 Tax=Micromonospora ureilytica TaxID=709868 RepID=A0A3N9XT63_9ACTN|nr:hypothetical protein DDE19_16360 [Micromonospora ureilytica]